MKTFFLLVVFAAVLPLPFCVFRRKKYSISKGQLAIIYFTFIFFGAIGAVVGSINLNGRLPGIRLYGLMLFHTLIQYPLSRLLKLKTEDFGDYTAVSNMAVCCFSKIVCVINGCCAGFEIFSDNGELIFQFPSQWFEIAIWGLMIIVLLYMEKTEKAIGLRWPLTIIWFGGFRFLAEFLRKPSRLNNNNIIFCGLNIANVFCLFLVVIGVITLYFALQKKLERKPKASEFVKSIIGLI